MAMVDEIWTSSEFCSNLFSASFRPVVKIPNVVRPASSPNEEVDRAVKARLNWQPGCFWFYAIAPATLRKNLPAAIKAFAGNFDPNNVALVIKTDRPLPSELSHTPGVIVVPEWWPDDWIAALHRLGDCLVSAHCGEGWGLCISDAMAHGNLVIATAFGGNMDFMSDKNALPVTYRLAPLPTLVRSSVGIPQDAKAEWANVDQQALSQAMSRAVYNWSSLAGRRKRAETEMGRYAPEVIEALLERRLLEIGASLRSYQLR
jgi:hypothetical protein